MYGTTVFGGDNDGSRDNGVVFGIKYLGTDYSHLHEFTDAGDGYLPEGSLTLVSSNLLYGMASGGQYGKGVMFRLTTGGIGYTNLHHFAGGANGEGEGPADALVLHDGQLYGMMDAGGTLGGWGVVFRIDLDGGGYTNLHAFEGMPAGDGGGPHGAPLIHDGFLYGMTVSGGEDDEGVVFRLALEQTGFDTPDILSLGISNQQAWLTWREVPGATSYQVQVAMDLSQTFTEDTSGVYPTATNWVCPITYTERFWRVTGFLP